MTAATLETASAFEITQTLGSALPVTTAAAAALHPA